MSPSERLRRFTETDGIGYPEGLDREAVLRALDRERIDELAPDLPRARRDRIVKLRQALRRGAYETREKLEIALARAMEDLVRRRRRFGEGAGPG